MQMQAPMGMQSPQSKFFQPPRFSGSYQKTNNFFNAQPYRQAPIQQGVEFDGKRLRKAVVRKTIDYNSAIVRHLELRVWQRDFRDQRAIQPDAAYYPDITPPPYFVHNPINAVTTKFVRTSTNKMRCPIFCVAWTAEGRRLVTGASSGEFTLWNGLTFNFETILQAHDSPVRCMVWSHNDLWMVTGDHSGFVKYWQSNMNNVKMFQAHKEPLRGIRWAGLDGLPFHLGDVNCTWIFNFCPTDHKFATCSDDGTVRIWDFMKCHEERILRGHGADVKCVAWHPQKGLLVSGSKDSQQPIKLWDPKSGQSLATLHAHKSTVMEAKWNQNGNWLLTGSRDHLIKLFDIRKLSQEVQTFRGHKKEVTSLAWHPIHETLFASGGSDGAVMFWLNGVDKEVGSMEQAHDSIVWALAWHPLGHILCSGSNDHTCKFWTRNRPGDKMRDKYNLNTLSAGNPEDAAEYEDMISSSNIPGMGLDQHHGSAKELDQSDSEMENLCIPGLDFGNEEPQLPNDSKMPQLKKVPYSKPIPRQFQQQWLDNVEKGDKSEKVDGKKRPLLISPMSGGAQGQSNQSQSGSDTAPSGMAGSSQQQQHQHEVGGSMGPQGFTSRMMGQGNSQGPPRMPMGNMMWAPPNQYQDGQMGSRYPGGQGFHEGSKMMNQGNSQAGFSKFPSGQKEPTNWKEYGDSDFRMPMDSDFRKLPEGRRGFMDEMGNPGNSLEVRLRGENQDQDMRPHSQEMEARMSDFNNFPNPETNTKTSSSGRVRVSRWSSEPVRNVASNFNSGMMPPGANFVGSDMKRNREGDWDERISPSRLVQGGGGAGGEDGNIGPNFNSPRKRGWDDGPGGMDSYDNMDFRNERSDGFSKSGFNPASNMQHQGGSGRNMSSWGPNRGGRNEMRGGRGMRSGSFRGRW